MDCSGSMSLGWARVGLGEEIGDGVVDSGDDDVLCAEVWEVSLPKDRSGSSVHALFSDCPSAFYFG